MNSKLKTRNSKLYLIGLLFIIAGCGNHKEVVGPEVSNRFANWPDREVRRFEPNQDSYYPRVVNTGSGEKLLAGRWQGYSARTLLKFDLSDIPANAVLKEAGVELYCFASDGSDPADLSLHEITDSWEENKVVWDKINFQETRDLGMQEVAGEGPVLWTKGITGFLSQKMTDGSDSSNISLLIKSAQEDLNISIKEFYSKEKSLGANDAETWPAMSIKYELAGGTEPTSVKLLPTRDVFIITKSEPETSTGQEDSLVIGAFNGYSNRMAIQFSIFPGEEDGLPDKATINYAELRLYGYNISGEESAPLSISVYTITEKWTDGQANPLGYNSSTKVDGKLTSDTVSLNITSLVKDWNRKGGNFGLLIKPVDEVGGASFKGVYSSEHSSPELRPVVVVTYTMPQTEPGYDK